MHARNAFLALVLVAAAARGAGADPAESAIARWIDQPAPYADSAGKSSHPVAFGLFGGAAETGSPADDVSVLRLGLASDHHNVGVLDLNLFYGHAGGRERGLQFGAVNVVEGPLSGVQLGLLVSVCGVLENSPSTGAQAALLVNYADELDGVQFGLAFNRRGEGAGLQVGLLNTAGAMNGVQFGLVNMATTSRGWQIGLYNDVQHAAGVQIGLANWASDAEFPLLPFFRSSF